MTWTSVRSRTFYSPDFPNTSVNSGWTPDGQPSSYGPTRHHLHQLPGLHPRLRYPIDRLRTPNSNAATPTTGSPFPLEQRSLDIYAVHDPTISTASLTLPTRFSIRTINIPQFSFPGEPRQVQFLAGRVCPHHNGICSWASSQKGRTDVRAADTPSTSPLTHIIISQHGIALTWDGRSCASGHSRLATPPGVLRRKHEYLGLGATMISDYGGSCDDRSLRIWKSAMAPPVAAYRRPW